MIRNTRIPHRNLHTYSPLIVKQDFRRQRDGWDAPSWSVEKPQMYPEIH